jgi:hypothetical protein
MCLGLNVKETKGAQTLERLRQSFGPRVLNSVSSNWFRNTLECRRSRFNDLFRKTQERRSLERVDHGQFALYLRRENLMGVTCSTARWVGRQGPKRGSKPRSRHHAFRVRLTSEHFVHDETACGFKVAETLLYLAMAKYSGEVNPMSAVGCLQSTGLSREKTVKRV